MYRLMRDTHLFLGAIFVLFLLMYGVSAVQMAHPDWFPMEPTTTEREIAVSSAWSGDPEAFARRVAREHELRGDVDAVIAADRALDVRIVRPGTVHEVHYVPGAADAVVRTHTATFMGMLNRIHHVGGLWHDYALIDLWGVLVGIVSVGLILLGLSGLYLWFRIHRERRVGAALLAASVGVSVTLMVLIRIAG